MIEVGGGFPHSLRYDWGIRFKIRFEYNNYYDNIIIIDQFLKVN